MKSIHHILLVLLACIFIPTTSSFAVPEDHVLREIVSVLQEAAFRLSCFVNDVQAVNRTARTSLFGSPAKLKLAFATYHHFIDWTIRNDEDEKSDLEAIRDEFHLDADFRLIVPYIAVALFQKRELMTVLESSMAPSCVEMYGEDARILRHLLVSRQ